VGRVWVWQGGRGVAWPVPGGRGRGGLRRAWRRGGRRRLGRRLGRRCRRGRLGAGRAAWRSGPWSTGQPLAGGCSGPAPCKGRLALPQAPAESVPRPRLPLLRQPAPWCLRSQLRTTQGLVLQAGQAACAERNERSEGGYEAPCPRALRSRSRGATPAAVVVPQLAEQLVAAGAAGGFEGGKGALAGVEEGRPQLRRQRRRAAHGTGRRGLRTRPRPRLGLRPPLALLRARWSAAAGPPAHIAMKKFTARRL
jgi:hypothetical protein